MDRRKGLMGHMAIGLNLDIVWKNMIQSEVVENWIHLRGGVVFMDYILVMFLR